MCSKIRLKCFHCSSYLILFLKKCQKMFSFFVFLSLLLWLFLAIMHFKLKKCHYFLTFEILICLNNYLLLTSNLIFENYCQLKLEKNWHKCTWAWTITKFMSHIDTLTRRQSNIFHEQSNYIQDIPKRVNWSKIANWKFS